MISEFALSLLAPAFSATASFEAGAALDRALVSMVESRSK
jgi:hypothetical protein